MLVAINDIAGTDVPEDVIDKDVGFVDDGVDSLFAFGCFKEFCRTVECPPEWLCFAIVPSDKRLNLSVLLSRINRVVHLYPVQAEIRQLGLDGHLVGFLVCTGG